MLLWLYLAGDTVNMGCNDILMLVAAPHTGPPVTGPGHRCGHSELRAGTTIAASETRTLSWHWGPMVPVEKRNTAALKMRRPPYTWDIEVKKVMNCLSFKAFQWCPMQLYLLWGWDCSWPLTFSELHIDR